MSIEVRQISKYYGKQKALDGVTFSIKKGEVVGFLGPNGAGKSTMMKILSAYIPASSGEAAVCGFDVIQQSLEVKRRIGYLAENNPLYLDMFVGEYLKFIAGLHQLDGDIQKKIADVIELTGLGNEQHKKLGALSKGYRQRAGLAQILIHSPEVLILDEPTSGLDPNQLLEIRNLIASIGKEKTVMLSTHIMQEVEAICHRVIIIDKGRIVADGTAASLNTGTGRKQLIHVEFDRSPEEQQLLSIQGVTAVSLQKDGNCILEAATDSDIRSEVFQFAVDNHFKVLSMKREEQKLEETFQKLTGSGKAGK